jgi:hypothetical protein
MAYGVSLEAGPSSTMHVNAIEAVDCSSYSAVRLPRVLNYKIIVAVTPGMSLWVQPTFAFLKDGEVKTKFSGADVAALRKNLEKYS